MTLPAKGAPKPFRPSNSKTLAQWNMEQLKKTADSRGIPLAKLIAQMVEQYLKEEKESGEKQ